MLGYNRIKYSLVVINSILIVFYSIALSRQQSGTCFVDGYRYLIQLTPLILAMIGVYLVSLFLKLRKAKILSLVILIVHLIVLGNKGRFIPLYGLIVSSLFFCFLIAGDLFKLVKAKSKSK